MSREALRRQQVSMLKRIEKPFARAVLTEKNRYIRAEVSSFMSRLKLSPSLLAQHEANLTKIYAAHGKLAVKDFGKLTASSLKCGCEWCMEKKDGTSIAATTFGKLAASWIAQAGASRIKDVAKTTRNDLQRALQRAEEEELDINDTEAALKAVTNLSAWRAATIGRTETHNAAMFASQGVADQISADTGIVLIKEWISVHDERTRESHAEADGQKVDLTGSFYVGGEELEYPSDPSGSPENIINCRCVQGFDEA